MAKMKFDQGVTPEISSLSIPSYAGSDTYSTGLDGQVLKTDGENIFWEDSLQVYDGLDSEETDVALQAAQGKALNDAIEEEATAREDAFNTATQNLESILTSGDVKKLGKDTVGGTSRPIYLNGGTPVAISATVGGTTTPIYLDSGSPTAGSAYVPVTGGTFTGVIESKSHVRTVNANASSTASPSSNTSNIIGHLTSDSKWLAYMQGYKSTDGLVRNILAARNYQSGSEVTNSLELKVAADGTRAIGVSDQAIWKTAIGCTVQNNLTYSTSNATNALSAYQGYLLKSYIDNKMSKTFGYTSSVSSVQSTTETTGYTIKSQSVTFTAGTYLAVIFATMKTNKYTSSLALSVGNTEVLKGITNMTSYTNVFAMNTVTLTAGAQTVKFWMYPQNTSTTATLNSYSTFGAFLFKLS